MNHTSQLFKKAILCAVLLSSITVFSCANGTNTTSSTDTTSGSRYSPAATDTMASPSSTTPDTTTHRDSM